jgi:replicative DNA helicase
MATILEHALFYASKGWPVFPLKPRDKIPNVKWQDVATTEVNMIHGWWDNQPDANVGITAGIKSNLSILDIDAAHGGEESLKELVKEHGDIPITPVCITGGGGRHLFFEYADGTRNSASKLGKGLDLRSEGGYVVGANSMHPSGKEYRWDMETAPSKTPLAKMPLWMIRLLLAEEPKILTPSEGAFAPGKRHDTLTSLAGSMQRRGMSEKAIFSALMHENTARCVPPLTEGEIRVIASSMSKYDPKAAPERQDRTRLQIEWAFAKSLFEYPIDAKDFTWIKPEMFSDKNLSIFWASIVSGKTGTSAATEAMILAELQGYKEYDSTRVDGYAKELVRFFHFDTVAYYANGLLRAANEKNQERVDKTILEIGKNVSLQTIHRVTSITDLAEQVETDIKKRAEEPGDVWGIPYAYPYLTMLTGGKQQGELTILAGEPKLGKSFWASQDALETAVTHRIPVFIWSGEMKKKQVMRRLYQLYGLDSRRSRTGYMRQEDWDILKEAKGAICDSPLYIDDNPLKLDELRGILAHEKDEHDIRQFLIDYAMLIHAPGKDEIERSTNVSTEIKNICSELNLAGILICSVNKTGMDTSSENVTKSNVRGSGQQIHDADNVMILTKFSKTKDPDEAYIMPNREDNIVSLHIAAGRELDTHLPGGILHYERVDGTPRFKELKQIENRPAWVEKAIETMDERKDL